MSELSPTSLLCHPYDRLVPVTGGRGQLKKAAVTPGAALVWRIDLDTGLKLRQFVEQRPGGVPLIAVLPDAEQIRRDESLLASVERCRPHGLLPTHGDPDIADVVEVLRRPAIDLAREVTDYLCWRGISLDRETTLLLRRIIDLSAELRSITALSRKMYLSRRALGRRLMTRGLPVPSHWLQLARILRLASRLQNSEQSIFTIAYESGYPDGFSVSNQMHRLVGYRPSEVRVYLGWEWIFEAWLRKEADEGRLAPHRAAEVLAGPRSNALASGPLVRRRAGAPATRKSIA